jgi:outer membrane protein assembly factor BamB
MDQGVYGSLAVVNGTVYVGDQNGTVYAIDGSSGATEWKFEIRGDETAEDPAKRFGVVNSPAVKNGVVYAVSYNGVVYALKSRTGEEIWNTSTGGLVASSPAVDGQSVYLGNYDGEVYSISRSTGRVEWRRKVSDGRISKSSPAVAGDTVVVGGVDGYLYSLGSETGERRWSYEASSPILSSAAVVNGNVYFSDSNGVYVVAGRGVEIGSLTAEVGVSEESSGTEDVDENRTENNTLIDSFLSLLERIFS